MRKSCLVFRTDGSTRIFVDTDPANLTQIPMINGHRHQAACCASRLESRANSRGRGVILGGNNSDGVSTQCNSCQGMTRKLFKVTGTNSDMRTNRLHAAGLHTSRRSAVQYAARRFEGGVARWSNSLMAGQAVFEQRDM